MTSVTLGYSIPTEAAALLQDGIIKNPLITDLPPELQVLSKLVRFEGNATPSIPINWRLAESISALKAFEATMVNCILKRKYGMEPVELIINTYASPSYLHTKTDRYPLSRDHASLFVMSIPLAQIRGQDGSILPISAMNSNTCRLYAPNERPSTESLHRMLATGIYRTKDDRFFHIHGKVHDMPAFPASNCEPGSLNSDPTLTALGLPLEGDQADTYEDVVQRIQKKVAEFNTHALDDLMNSKYRQAGTSVMSSEEYFATAHAQANKNVGLYEIIREKNSSQPAAWWPENSSMPSSPSRPLAGLKVVDLTRVIAGPTITRGLAELGASVMRVTSPHVVDWPRAFHDLNWGKWNTFLHLKDENDKSKLQKLILDADVVVDGYRPGVMDRLGFGREAIFDLVKDRGRGIIHLRENCYGWHGPWANRSGWQGISDAVRGEFLTMASRANLTDLFIVLRSCVELRPIHGTRGTRYPAFPKLRSLVRHSTSFMRLALSKMQYWCCRMRRCSSRSHSEGGEGKQLWYRCQYLGVPRNLYC
jgi:hypothetical protein